MPPAAPVEETGSYSYMLVLPPFMASVKGSEAIWYKNVREKLGGGVAISVRAYPALNRLSVFDCASRSHGILLAKESES